MSISDSITPLPLDPELLGELLEKLPAWVIEQLTNNWRRKMKKGSAEKRIEPGFTLIETLLVLVVFAVIAASVTLGVTQAINDSKGKECSTNLATIEGAKDEFARDNPGVALTSVDQLKPYLRYGLPTCPAGGTYEHVLDLNQPCTCSLRTDKNGTKIRLV